MTEQHEAIFRSALMQLRPILDSSEQAVYLYLDDIHRACNENLASLLGYSSPAAWAATESALGDIPGQSQQAAAAAYESARRKMAASSLEVFVRHRDTGKLIPTRMVVVPFPWRGEFLALYFLSEL
jgi:hypothetical protein